MKTLLALSATAILLAASSPARAQLYVYGTFCSNCQTPGTHNQLFDDGLHNDGAAGDGILGVDITVDQAAGSYPWYVSTIDGLYVGYPSCPCQPSYAPYTSAHLWTTGPGDVVHFALAGGGGWYPGAGVATDHGLPGPVPLEVAIDAPYDPWSFPPLQTAAATKVGSIWEATALIASGGYHTYAFQTPDRTVIFTGSYNGRCGCFFGEQPVASFSTTVPNTYMRFQFDESVGRMRVEQVVATATRRTSWGAIRAMYR